MRIGYYQKQHASLRILFDCNAHVNSNAMNLLGVANSFSQSSSHMLRPEIQGNHISAFANEILLVVMRERPFFGPLLDPVESTALMRSVETKPHSLLDRIPGKYKSIWIGVTHERLTE